MRPLMREGVAMSVFEEIGRELVGQQEPSWSRLCEAIARLRDLDQTPQDPRHHAEGDVGLHTRMVIWALRDDPAWMAMDLRLQALLAWACLLHDIGKPARTRVEDDGSISSRGHSGAGELMARRILWEMGAGAPEREFICRVAKWHQIPFFAGLACRSDGTPKTVEELEKNAFDIQKLSLSLNLSLLAICSRADALGRRTFPACEREKTLDAIDAFEILARDLQVWDRPRACAGVSERGIWLAKSGENMDPSFAWPDPSPRAVLVAACGLPGSGKSTLAQGLGLPVVGLDWAREKLDAKPGESVGEAASLAHAELKKLLGKGSSVFFDATNLIADHRERLAQLASDYQADCVFVHVEPPSKKEWLARNKARGSKGLPAKALEGMLSRWGAPVGFEGAAQVFWDGAGPAPVWGALDASGWQAVATRALASAQEPLGKPKQGRAGL